MKRFLIAFLLAGAVQGQTISAIAHRPDMTPEPVDFTKELPIDTKSTLTNTWLTGRMLNATNMVNWLPGGDHARIVGSPCLTFEDPGSIITFTGKTFPAGATVTNEGTSTLTLGATNTITGTSGTAWNIRIFDGATLWAHLPTTENSGTTIYDISGNGNHGTLTTGAGGTVTAWGTTQDVSHPFAEKGGSKVLSFAGNAYGTLPSCALTTNGFTISGNIRIAGTSGFHTVAAQYNPGTNKRAWQLYSDSANNTLVFRASTDGTTATLITSTSDAVFSPSEFFNFSVVRSRTNVTFTKNGTPAGSASAPADIFTSDDPVSIGRRNDGSELFSGRIISLDVSLLGSYTAANAYGTTLPDSVGTNDATLVNTEFVNIPAMSSGTNDAAGLGITNPGGLAHNNGPHSLVIAGVTNSYANLLTNGFYTIETNANNLIEGLYQ